MGSPTMTAARASLATVKNFSCIPGPRSFPVVGSCLQYRYGTRNKTAYHLGLLDMFEQYGPIVQEHIGGKAVVHVFCPEDIKTVYSVEGKWPVIPPLQETTAMYREQKEMSLGLGNSQQRMLRPREVAHYLPS